MTYSTEQIAQNLKAARNAKGLSQRALAKLVDLPQSHISKIENAGVDLRLSSLIQIARALDLELTLVPRRTLPAVQSLARSSVASKGGLAAMQENMKAYERLEEAIELALEDGPAIKEIAQIRRQIRDLRRLKIPLHDTAALQRATQAIRVTGQDDQQLEAVRQVLADFQRLRNEAVHSLQQDMRAKPAYSLKDDDDG